MTCIIGIVPFLFDISVFYFVGDLDLYAEPKAYQDQSQDEEEAETKL